MPQIASCPECDAPLLINRERDKVECVNCSWNATPEKYEVLDNDQRMIKYAVI